MMADESNSNPGQAAAVWLLTAAGAIVLVILYALFAGGGVAPPAGPVALDGAVAPLVDPGPADPAAAEQ